MGFSEINTADKNLQLIQANIKKAVAPIDSSPFVGGVSLASISLTAGQDNLVAHKLGKVPSAWVLTNQDSSATVWSPASTQLGNAQSTTSYLNLRCSANCTISLWVFG